MQRAFTLVEILIVVIVLGILASLVVPSMINAAEDAAETATYTELGKLRRAVDAYRARENSLPDVTAGAGTWGGLVSSEYLKSAPINAWVGRENGQVIVIRDTPDAGFQDAYGWIYDDQTGQIWAGGYDAVDIPYTK